MPIDDIIEGMKAEAEEMARYYCDSFISGFQTIFCVAYAQLEGQQDIECHVNNAYGVIEAIEEQYTIIPFEQLHGREEFYPLFVVKRLLPKVRREMDCLFKEHKGKDAHDALVRAATDVCEVGQLYGALFETLLKKIWSLPEGQDFRIRVIDYKGRSWTMVNQNRTKNN